MNLLNGIRKKLNLTTTENGGVTNKSSLNKVLDFFFMGGSLRRQSEERIISVFKDSFLQDKLLSLKSLFYFRDIRKGQGERKVFRVIMSWLTKHYPDIVIKNVHLFSEFGRWDDIYSVLFINSDVDNKVKEIIQEQLNEDLKNDNVSLLGKWLKSINTSSNKSRQLGIKTCKLLGMSKSQYRKTLSKLRKKIDIVERKISNNEWKDINYERVPSQASLKYMNAFKTHDEEGYLQYIDDIKNNKSKINTSTLYPYQIVKPLLDSIERETEMDSDTKQQHDNLWNNLPNYYEDENNMVVVDTSGSMYGSDFGTSIPPIYVSVSLGLYMSEKNKGFYKNKFITFSQYPELQEIQGESIYEKIMSIHSSNWGYNTDIERVFDLILNTSLENNLKQEDLPKRLIIISDMEFDSSNNNFNENKSLMVKIKDKFEKHGYELPLLVYWNVDSRNNNVPMTIDERGFQLISGFSPVILEHVIKGEFLSAEELMLSVIESDRYKDVTI